MISTTRIKSNSSNYFELMEDQFRDACRKTSETNNVRFLKDYLNKTRKKRFKEVNTLVPTIFHKQWIKTSVNGHIKILRRAIKYHVGGELDKYNEDLNISSLWLGQAKKIFEMTIFMRNLEEKEIKELFISEKNTVNGDIVLSYKTMSYIKKSNVSKLVKLAGNSSITHVMLVHEKSNEKYLLHSGDESKGLGLKPIQPKTGEIFLVMRLRNPDILDALNPVINRWAELARDRELTGEKYDRLSFSEVKCQVASLIGFATVLATYAEIPISLHNPFKNRPGVFCSETVDLILKEVDIKIAPRSERDSVIGPVEFFYSPLLEFRGIITNEGDTRDIFNELREQFK